MPAPSEVVLFSVAAYHRQALADDTDWFLQNADPQAATTLNACIRAAAAAPTPGARLRETGLRLEERYLSWRMREPHASLAATRMTYDSMASQVGDFLPRIAVDLVAAGHLSLTERALRRAEADLGYLSSVAVLKRAAMRCRHDSRDYDAARLAEMCDVSNEAFVEPDYDEGEVESLRCAIRRVVDRGLPERGDLRTARDYMRHGAQSDRRAMKRSLRTAERFVGTEPTRLFVSGKAIRITGRLAAYEITRNGSLMSDHGGAVLSVYTREGDVFLCNLCLYTKGVPLLDHVASIFLHIRAGEEEAILDIGNAYDVAPEAKAHAWLLPHLRRSEAPERTAAERDGRDLPSRRLVADLAVHLFEEIGAHCPPMPETRSHLERGGMPGDWVLVRAGEEAPGMPELAA